MEAFMNRRIRGFPSGDYRKGSALMIVMGLLTMMMFMGVMALNISRDEVDTSRDHEKKSSAQMSAMSGIEEAQKKLIDQTDQFGQPYLNSYLYGRPPVGSYDEPIRQPAVPIENAYWASFSMGEAADGIDNNGDGTVDGTGENEFESDTDANGNHSVLLPDQANSEGNHRFGYSGELPAAMSGERIINTVKVQDANGKIYINGPDSSPLNEKPDQELAPNKVNLLNKLGKRLEGIEDQYLGQRINSARNEIIAKTGNDFESVEDLRQTGFKYSSDEEIQTLKQHLTAHAWVDKSTLDPRAIEHEDTSKLYRKENSITQILQPRAPVNINDAPKEVIAAVLEGVEATYLHRFTNSAVSKSHKGKPTNTPGDLLGHDTVSVGEDLARNLAEELVDERQRLFKEEGPGFTSFRQLNNFIYSLHDEIKNWSDYSSDDRVLYLQQAIVANINPDSRIPHVNSSFSRGLRYGDVSKAELGEELQSGDSIVGWTTEFCLRGKGIYHITSLGRVLGPHPDEDGYRVKAQKKIEATVKVFNTYRLSTQKEFHKNLTSGSLPGNVRTFPENAADVPDSELASYDGYLKLRSRDDSSNAPHYRTSYSPNAKSDDVLNKGTSSLDPDNVSELFNDGVVIHDDNEPQLTHKNIGNRFGEKGWVGAWIKPTWFGNEFPSGENTDAELSGSRGFFDFGGYAEKTVEKTVNYKHTHCCNTHTHSVTKSTTESLPNFLQSGFMYHAADVTDDKAGPYLLGIHGSFDKATSSTQRLMGNLEDSLKDNYESVLKQISHHKRSRGNLDSQAKDALKEMVNSISYPVAKKRLPGTKSSNFSSSSIEDVNPYAPINSEELRKNWKSWYFPGRWHYIVFDWDASPGGKANYRVCVDGDCGDWVTQQDHAFQTWKFKDGWNMHVARLLRGLGGKDGFPYFGDFTLDELTVKSGNYDGSVSDRYRKSGTLTGVIGPRKKFQPGNTSVQNNRSSRMMEVKEKMPYKGRVLSVHWNAYEPNRNSTNTDVSVTLSVNGSEVDVSRSGTSFGDRYLTFDKGDSQPIEFTVKLTAEGDPVVVSPILDHITIRTKTDSQEVIRYSSSDFSF